MSMHFSRLIGLTALILALSLTLNLYASTPQGSANSAIQDTWPVAISGRAYDVVLLNDTPTLQSVATAFPVLYSAGYSSRHSFIAYTTLDGFDESFPNNRKQVSLKDLKSDGSVTLVPSGDLYVQRLSDGEYRKINASGQYVVSASWAPGSDHQIAYTFSTGSDFGLAISDARSGHSKILRATGVLADFISWNRSGDEVIVYERGEEKSTDKSQDVPDSLRINIPTWSVENFEFRNTTARAPQIDLPRLASGPFTVHLPDGTEFRGDSQQSLSRLTLLSTSGERQVDASVFVAALPSGILYRDFVNRNGDLMFFSSKGQVTRIAAKTVSASYYLPFPLGFGSIAVTQIGQAYSTSSGFCLASDHTFNNGMAFAYDLQGSINALVLASSSGTLVYERSDVNCNSLDTSGCTGSSGYSPSCTGSTSNFGWGNVVLLHHADGTWTKYTHLAYNSVLPTRVGTAVGGGCQIANQGHTGATVGNLNGCGDHVHFQRQNTSDPTAIPSSSISVTFSDTPNPLACTSYNPGNGGRSCVF
ncbi:MAG TPA: M23 family metallopeptidase [Thermoanaerobaculia bacterium]|nr:M23 family metallopeptidase [Thermoanaerobaculia bacterium]